MATRADLGSLSEGQRLDGVPLSLPEAAALNATELVTATPTASGWRVTAAYKVGALRCGDLDVRVQPKVGSLQVLRLLARAHRVDQLKLDAAQIELARDHDLTAVLALLFASEAATAMAPGPLRGYRTEDQTLSVLRGRLRMCDQELRRFGQLAPLEVTLDEWTTDTDENRRLRAATRRLLAAPRLPDLTRRLLIRLDRQLADVTIAPIGAPLAPWLPTRLNARLHALLALADLVLSFGAVEHRVGDVSVRGFVLSMSDLFEKLITQLLLEAASDVVISSQRSLPLDHGQRLTIKPDVIVTRDRTDIAVADLKYKVLDENGKFPNPDAYQLITYCTRLGLETGHLIYAAGEPLPETINIRGSGVTLAIHAIDLNQPVEVIEEQTRTLLKVLNRTPVQPAFAEAR